IHDVSSSSLVLLLNDEKSMKKIFKIPSKVSSTLPLRVKRNPQMSENGNDLAMNAIIDILSAIQSVGPENFAKSLLLNINDTYLDSQIENMRVDAIVSSDWLSPMMLYLSNATNSLAHLDKLGAFIDLEK
ncbi:unnamed protein product, partial [Meganyctiphanes norvegica]